MTKIREALNWWDTLSETKKGELTNQYYGHSYEAELTSDEVLVIFIEQSKVPPPESTAEEVAESKVCHCGVPLTIHNTACGWENASPIIFSWETSIPAAMTAHEKQIRYLLRNENEETVRLNLEGKYWALDPLAKADQLLHEMIDDIEKLEKSEKSIWVIQHLSKAHEIIHNYEENNPITEPLNQVERALKRGYIAGAEEYNTTGVGHEAIEYKANQFIKLVEK
ncbi:MAG: hypothetical protein V4547_17175 [Bacteroidota bacterium]